MIFVSLLEVCELGNLENVRGKEAFYFFYQYRVRFCDLGMRKSILKGK